MQKPTLPYLDWLLEHPYDAVEDLSKTPRNMFALGIFITSISSIAISDTLLWIPLSSLKGLMVPIIIYNAIGIVIWLLLTAFIHLFAELTGGRGKIKSLMSILGISAIPYTLTLPLAIMVKSFGKPFIFIYLTALFVIFVWSCTLWLYGVKVNYNLTRVQATIVSFVPTMLTGAAITLIALIVILITILFNAGICLIGNFS